MIRRDGIRALRALTAFDILHLVLHALAHHKSAAALHGDIPGKPGVAAQLKHGIILHCHIRGRIRIVPVFGIEIAFSISSGGRAETVHGIGSLQDKRTAVDHHTAPGTTELRKHAVERQLTVSSAVIHKFQHSGATIIPE